MLTSDQIIYIAPLSDKLKKLIQMRMPYIRTEEARYELIDACVKAWRIEAKYMFDIHRRIGEPNSKDWVIKEFIDRMRHSPHAKDLPDTLYADIEEMIFPDT